MRRTYMSTLVSAVVIAVTAVTVIAERPDSVAGEEPWRVSWEKRMALRFGPDEGGMPSSIQQDDPMTPPPGVVVIKGVERPELLTGIELFGQLLSTAFAPDPRARDFWRETYGRAGLPGSNDSEFWQRIEELAAPILEIRERERGAIERWKLDGTPPTADWELPAPALQCQVRARALAAARREFTPQLFDRFLYEAVAPRMTIVSSRNESELRYVEEGCR